MAPAMSSQPNASTVTSVAVMLPRMQRLPSRINAMPSARNQPQESWILSSPDAMDAPIELFVDMAVTSLVEPIPPTGQQFSPVGLQKSVRAGTDVETHFPWCAVA